MEQVAHRRSVIGNLFEEPLLEYFRPLLEPSGGRRLPGPFDNSPLHLLLEIYRQRHNRWLNGYLNMTFWEMGKEVLEHPDSLLPGPVTKRHLFEMVAFAGQSQGVAVNIAQLLPWQYIVILFSIPDPETQLFYARLAAAEGLSIGALRKKIAARLFENTPGARQQVQEWMAGMHTSHTNMKKKNVVLSIVEKRLLHAQDNRLVMNIFKNRYWRLLLYEPI
jgi:hypothetical protein